jgi:hypothetical protein
MYVLGIVLAHDDLCRVIELDVSNHVLPWSLKQFDEKLFYRTDFICQKKPIFRSLVYDNLYQFQSLNRRWWTLYHVNTSNTTVRIGTRQWCEAWHMQPILAMPSSIFQLPWKKPRRLQRWQHISIHENNRSFTYKTISSE